MHVTNLENILATFLQLSAKHRFASAVYATANPSVCPSVCPSHSDIVSKRGNAEECGLRHRVAQCLWFSDAEDGWWLPPCTGEILVQRGPPCENIRAVHISPHHSRTVIDSEKSSIYVNRSWPWAFQKAINQSRTSP